MVHKFDTKIIIGFLFFLFLPGCSGYDNYSDVIEWEPVADREGGVIAHFYQWHNGLSSHQNVEHMYNPLYFGLPADTDLCYGGGPIRWTYISIVGPKYAVLYKNDTYSNSSDMVYNVGYLPEPKTSLNGVTIDSVTAIERAYDGVMLEVDIKCEWHTSSRRPDGGIKKKHRVTMIHQKVHNNVTTWIQAEEYNQTVECVITNHSGYYNTINMTGLPDNASHYSINVTMGNVTKSLLKSSYVYFKNESVDYQLYDMHDYDFYELDGVSPFGKNEFLLPDGYIDDIEVVVSSPFESYKLETNITRIDEEKGINEFVICSALMCFVTIYVLYRMLRL